MKVVADRRHVAVALVAVGLTALLAGCEATPTAEDLGSITEALTPGASASAPSSGRSTSALEVSFGSWSSDRALHEASASVPVKLHVVNSTSRQMDGDVSIEINGVGAQRTQKLGHVLVPPNGSRDVDWMPSSSPIVGSGTLIRAMGRVSYAQGTDVVSIPSETLFASFSADGARVFATAGDGSQARARAAATLPKGAAATGSVDGNHAAVATASDTTSDPAPARPSPNVTDLAAQAPATAAPSGAAGLVAPLFVRDLCVSYGGTHKTANMCAYYGAWGFRDVQVPSGTIPTESFNPVLSPASFANASISISGGVVASGALDASGCMSFNYCKYPSVAEPTPTMTVATDSLSMLGGGLPYAARSHIFNILPARTFTSTALWPVSSGSTITYLWPSSDQDNYVLRVAAVLSHMLATAFAGADEPIPYYPVGTAPASTIDTTNGCKSLPYAPGLWGEACATPEPGGTANVAFGPSLGWDAPTMKYVPTGHHSTEDVFAIAHEFGHMIQFINVSVFPASDGSYRDKGTGAYCSCANVTDGNTLHCLQSSHQFGTAFSEGWAHHHAVRVMNSLGAASPRFTYYKNVLVQQDAPPALPGSFAPPVPVNAGVPYSYYTWGWVNNWCSAPGRASEYDWMTLLWSLNGVAASDRVTYADLLWIFSLPITTQATGMSWQNVQDAANARFGYTDARALRVAQQISNNGLAL